MDKENKPDVEWISLHPEEIFTIKKSVKPDKTSLERISNYLLEDKEEPRKLELSISPKTLEEIQNAEKLMKDTENFIFKISHSSYFVDEVNEFENEVNSKNDRTMNKYVKTIVASTFKKGYYEELSTENLPLKFKSIPKKVYQRKNHKSTFFKNSNKTLTRGNFKPSVDNCELCKLNKIETSKKYFDKSKNLETVRELCVQDKPDKLNVQKGPVINIKGDLNIQTSGVVDIEPINIPIISESQNNIATYQICHDSNEEKESINTVIKKKNNPDNHVVAEKLELIEKDSKEKPEQEFLCSHNSDSKQIDRTVPLNINNSQLITNGNSNYLSNSNKKIFKSNFDSSLDYEDFDFDFVNCSLPEPQILTDVDVILDRQRKIIRQMDETTRRFDNFLTERFQEDVSSEYDDSDEIIDSKSSCKKIEELNRTSMTNDNKKTDSVSEINNVYSKYKSLNIPQFKSLPKNQSFDKHLFHDFVEKKESESNLVVKLKKLKPRFNDKTNEKKQTTFKDSPIEIVKNVVEYQDFSNDIICNESEILSRDRFECDTEEKKSSCEYSNNIFASESSTSFTLINEFNKSFDDINCVDIKKKISEEIINFKNEQKKGSSNENLKISSEKNVMSDRNNYREETKNYKTGIKQHNDCRKSLNAQSNENSDEEISQTTSHLIEDIENIDIHLNLENSLHLFVHNANNPNFTSTKTTEKTVALNSDEISNDVPLNFKTNSESNKNDKSEELEIKNKSSNDLNSIPKITNYSGYEDSNSRFLDASAQINNDLVEKKVAEVQVSEVFEEGDNNNYVEHLSNGIESNNLYNSKTNYRPSIMINSGSFMSMLERNSSTLNESVKKEKTDLLRKLESCYYKSLKGEKHIFSSTVNNDSEPYFGISMSKWSESSSETHSEGEVRLNSSASYSLGEVRRKNNSSESNLLIKVSTTNCSQRTSSE